MPGICLRSIGDPVLVRHASRPVVVGVRPFVVLAGTSAGAFYDDDPPDVGQTGFSFRPRTAGSRGGRRVPRPANRL